MPIQTECKSCGRALKARDELAGKKVICPGCGEKVLVPPPFVTPMAEPEVYAFQDDGTAAAKPKKVKDPRAAHDFQKTMDALNVYLTQRPGLNDTTPQNEEDESWYKTDNFKTALAVANPALAAFVGAASWLGSDGTKEKKKQPRSEKQVAFDSAKSHLMGRGFPVEERKLMKQLAPLILEMNRDSLQSLLKHGKVKDERRFALAALVDLRALFALPIEEILRMLKEEDDFYWRLRAAAVLGALQAYADVGVPALIDALKDPHRDVRSRAAMALGNLGPAAAQAVPNLCERFTDEYDVARAAGRALCEIGEAAQDAIPLMAQAIIDGKKLNLTEKHLAKIEPINDRLIPMLVAAYRDKPSSDLLDVLRALDPASARRAVGVGKSLLVGTFKTVGYLLVVAIVVGAAGYFGWQFLERQKEARLASTPTRGPLTIEDYHATFDYQPPEGWTIRYDPGVIGVTGKERIKVEITHPKQSTSAGFFLVARKKITEEEMLSKMQDTFRSLAAEAREQPSLDVAGKKAHVFELKQKDRTLRFYAFLLPEQEIHFTASVGADHAAFPEVREAFERSLTALKIK